LPPALRDHPQAGSAATPTFAPPPKIFWINNFNNVKIVNMQIEGPKFWLQIAAIMGCAIALVIGAFLVGRYLT
jgi:hypothetical protein